jgi:hypothetical protein
LISGLWRASALQGAGGFAEGLAGLRPRRASPSPRSPLQALPIAHLLRKDHLVPPSDRSLLAAGRPPRCWAPQAALALTARSPNHVTPADALAGSVNASSRVDRDSPAQLQQCSRCNRWIARPLQPVRYKGSRGGRNGGAGRCRQ